MQKETIETYVESYGYACQGQTPPCIQDTVTDTVLDIPATAQKLEVWFWCVPGFSQGAESNWMYDSALGANYSLPIIQGAHAIDWAGDWQMYLARPGTTQALPDPIIYTEFTNMGLAAQASLYVKGLTDQPEVDTALVKAYVETDLLNCTPGGDKIIQEIQATSQHGGPYNSNSVYQWGFEGLISPCPNGTYHFRFLFSADGGLTTTALGAASATGEAGADAFRTLISQ